MPQPSSRKTPFATDPSQRPDQPRDLIDFHLRWEEFRPHIEAILKRGGLSEPERETVTWLMLLADRVREHDVTDDGDG